MVLNARSEQRGLFSTSIQSLREPSSKKSGVYVSAAGAHSDSVGGGSRDGHCRHPWLPLRRRWLGNIRCAVDLVGLVHGWLPAWVSDGEHLLQPEPQPGAADGSEYCWPVRVGHGLGAVGSHMVVPCGHRPGSGFRVEVRHGLWAYPRVAASSGPLAGHQPHQERRTEHCSDHPYGQIVVRQPPSGQSIAEHQECRSTEG